MNSVTVYKPPPLSQRKIDIHQEFEKGKTITEISEELAIKPYSVIANILDSYQNDLTVDFKKIEEEFNFLSTDKIDLVKKIIIEKENQVQLYCHDKKFTVKDIQETLQSNTLGLSEKYLLIKVAIAQLHFERFHHLPRIAKRKLIKGKSGQQDFSHSAMNQCNGLLWENDQGQLDPIIED